MKKLLIITAIAMSIIACKKQPLPTECSLPDFAAATLDSYLPAFNAAIAEYNSEIDAIIANPDEPTFENTVAALDRSGLALQKEEGIFFNLLETDGNDEMNELAEQISALITDCQDNILMNAALFARIQKVHDNPGKLNAEEARLLEVTYRNFVQSGACLSEADKERVKQINQELALLSLRFGQNVVAETNACKRFVKDVNELKGLPESALQAALEEGEAAGHKGEYCFMPKRTSFTPVLQYCENRELRKLLLMDYTTRGNHDNKNDNKVVINRTMLLRTEKAHIFGFDCAADYILQDAMAHDGKSAIHLLEQVWTPSLEAAKRERAELQALLDADIAAGKVVASTDEEKRLQPWDWWYYTEQLRAAKYALSEEELRPYFKLDNVRKGAFDLAHRLYGITIEPIAPEETGVLYHPDVEAFRLTGEDGALLGYFLTDYFPRATKRAGAWMNNMTPQYIKDGVNYRPVIVNVGNFTKPTADAPSLLSMDDVETLFHEFGHALHGFLSQVTFQSLAGTNVPRDFVELPSQVNENWCYAPEVMKTYAFHYLTGEVIPDSLIEKINAASKFNQGFVETELLSASILDMDYHMLTYDEVMARVAAASDSTWLDVNAFEAASMERMQMIPEIITRYRSTFYNHIFTTGYEAGYYSYTWSAVLDSDAFHAFVETGDIFDQKTARRFRDEVLSRGNTADAAVLYRNFRGKDACPDYLLEKKGLK